MFPFTCAQSNKTMTSTISRKQRNKTTQPIEQYSVVTILFRINGAFTVRHMKTCY